MRTSPSGNGGERHSFERLRSIESLIDNWGLAGSLDRVSISPDETKIDLLRLPNRKKNDEMPARKLYVADLEVKDPTITNAEPFANAERKNLGFGYPRWTKGRFGHRLSNLRKRPQDQLSKTE